MSSPPGLPANQVPGFSLNIKWDPEFSKRRSTTCTAENKPYLEVIAETGLEKPVEYTSWLDELEDALSEFMRQNDRSDVCKPEADIVLAFCSYSSFQDLLRDRRTKLDQTTWVDDRNFQGGRVQARAQRGALTAFDLYQSLKKPVSRLASE